MGWFDDFLASNRVVVGDPRDTKHTKSYDKYAGHDTHFARYRADSSGLRQLSYFDSVPGDEGELWRLLREGVISFDDPRLRSASSVKDFIREYYHPVKEAPGQTTYYKNLDSSDVKRESFPGYGVSSSSGDSSRNDNSVESAVRDS